MRYLAIDLGDKRTGLAVGDDALRIASPVGVVEAARGGGELVQKLLAAVDEHLGRGDEVVFGLPVNMDGTEGERAKLVRDYAGSLGLDRAVHFQDERLTSADADWKMARTGLTHKQKKGRRDAMAAAAILQDFLDGLPRE